MGNSRRHDGYSAAQLYREVVEVACHDARLRQAVGDQRRVTGPGDQGAVQPGALGADGVPDVGGDHHAVGGLNLELLAYVVVDRRGGFERAAGVDTELPLEEAAEPGVLQRARAVWVRRGVRQCEKAETVVAQRGEAVGDVGMRGHRQHGVFHSIEVRAVDVDTVNVREHLQDRLPEGEEVDVAPGCGRGHRVHDELAEPLAQRVWVAKCLLEKRCQRVDVDECLVDVEHEDGRRRGHLLIIDTKEGHPLGMPLFVV